MDVQVIMNDGRPEWAVIPYPQYEALLLAAAKGQDSASTVTAAPDSVSAPVPVSPERQPLFPHATTTGGGVFSVAKLLQLKSVQGKNGAGLAKDAGISPAYYLQIESGERTPSPAIIRGLAQALKVKADDLLDTAINS